MSPFPQSFWGMDFEPDNCGIPVAAIYDIPILVVPRHVKLQSRMERGKLNVV